MKQHVTEPLPGQSYRAALRDLRRTCGVAFGFSAVINVLMLTGSIYMLQVYDRVLASGSVPTLLGLFVIVVVLYAFLGLYDFLRARLLARAAVRLDRAVGPAAFKAWMTDGLSPKAAKGEAQGQPLRDLDTLRGFLSGGAISAVFDAPWVPLFLGVLFIVHPILGWLTVAGALVGVAIAGLNHLLTRRSIKRTLALEAQERELTDQSRRGAEAIVAMGMQRSILSRWQRRRDAALAAGQASGDPAEMLAATSRSFRMLLQSAILTAGAWLVIRGEISAGMIIASSILSGRALGPVDALIGNWRTIQRASLARRSLDGFFAELPAEPARVRLPEPKGRLSVAGLVKLAPEAAKGAERRPILDGVGFELSPGDALGVIGASGSGKSTLARLLVGIAGADKGEVRLDGATLDQWEPAEIGRHVGYLPQFPNLMSGTVRDVIARFDPETEDDTVIAAARLAGIHDMVLSLPEGYATPLGGTGGVQLSGGQMQRLGLARAVCGLPRLVVLDEPNAHLDAAGEEALKGVVTALRMANSVVIVIAHRPSVLSAVNKVLVLQAGRVERFGDTGEILAANGAQVSRGDDPAAAPLPAVAFANRPEAPAAPAAAMPKAVAERMQRLSEGRVARLVTAASGPRRNDA